MATAQLRQGPAPAPLYVPGGHGEQALAPLALLEKPLSHNAHAARPARRKVEDPARLRVPVLLVDPAPLEQRQRLILSQHAPARIERRVPGLSSASSAAFELSAPRAPH